MTTTGGLGNEKARERENDPEALVPAARGRDDILRKRNGFLKGKQRIWGVGRVGMWKGKLFRGAHTHVL